MKKLSVKLTKAETIIGFSYIVFQLLVLPTIVVYADAFFHLQLNEAELNFICFAFNFIALTVIFRRFLLESARVFFRAPGRAMAGVGIGFAINFGGNVVVSALITALDPEFSNVNDGSISNMIDQSAVLIYLSTILLAPVAEEILFRGVFFGTLYRKLPVLAFIASAVVFSAMHVVSYIGSYPALRLILCFIQYLPASVALAYAYAHSDTIWSPILMHITLNTLGSLMLG